MHKEILEDIGEKELINRLGKFMPKNQVSDDCALIKTKNENLPINRAEEFFVLQTGDPIGDDIGYIDPETNEERHVPLEIRIPDEQDTFYNQTFEDLGLYTETPTLPFATLGTLGSVSYTHLRAHETP